MIVGWISSVVLVLTITHQIWTQWKNRTSDGVSPWLFVGQMIASTGFTIYSVMQKDVVFTVTNALLVVSAFVGLMIVLHQRRRARGRPTSRHEATSSTKSSASSRPSSASSSDRRPSFAS